MLGYKASNLLRIKNVKHQFFTRKGGTSPRPWDYLNVSHDVGDVTTRVDENRIRIATSLGVDPDRFFHAKQVHKTKIVEVKKLDKAKDISKVEADCIWTRQPGFLVGVLTADCAPVLFSHEQGSFVGAIHVGWRGAVAGHANSALQEVMKLTETSPKELRVAIGPCIGFESFEVGQEVVDEASKLFELGDLIRKDKSGKLFFNLPGFIQKHLTLSHFAHVDILDFCTFKNHETFYSYRKTKGKCGRQFSGIVCG